MKQTLFVLCNLFYEQNFKNALISSEDDYDISKKIIN